MRYVKFSFTWLIIDHVLSQYLYDESIKEDPVAYQKLYDEVKIEAAMIMSVSRLVGLFSCPK